MIDTLRKLIGYLIATDVLKTPRIIKAFRAVDRRDFVPKEHEHKIYEDCPIPIGRGQTISQPYTVAFMLELLEPHEDQKILDVGSGSGWTTALLAHIVGPSGNVTGVEIIPELVEFGQQNLKKYDFTNTRIEPVGDVIGAPEKGPFDRILVSAAGIEVPKALSQQLKPDGVMVIPVQNTIQKIYKDADGHARTEVFEGFAFVPLIT